MPKSLLPIDRKSGTWRQVTTTGEHFKAFIPSALPPQPALQLDESLQEILEQANQAIGRLDGVTSLLPDSEIFLYSYVRKEAVLSSQIEGTQSSLSELLLFENSNTPGVPLDDVKEVSRYVDAMQHGIKRMADGFPLSLRLIREMHEILLTGVRGGHKNPGEFRRSQNWIGGSRPGNAAFVPPPPQDVPQAMAQLEQFIHGKPAYASSLIKAGLVHVQFESIHPFLDGNGRLGRLLISLMLVNEGVLTMPLLYLSLYFKQHRKAYYQALQDVRLRGHWEAWLQFYLTGVQKVATEATETVRTLSKIAQSDLLKVRSLGRAGFTAERVHGLLQKRILLAPSVGAKALKLSFPATLKALMNLEKLGLVKEVTGKTKDRVFAYQSYLKVLTQGTD